jgi:hypothetical protein
MILTISEKFAAEIRSYVGFTQSRSRNNLEASINGAAGVFSQVAVHASHGEANQSGLAEWPGFPKIPPSAFRDREWRLRRHELMFPPRNLYPLYSISIRQYSIVLYMYCQSLRYDVLRYHTQSKASSIITFLTSSGLVRVCVFVFVSARLE